MAVDRLARLLGSSTRANLIRALAMSSSPLTSYRVATLYNMNVPKVYGEMRNLTSLGVVEPTSQGRGVKYRLVDDDLKRLVLRLSPDVVTLEAWRSEEAKRIRFRAGLGTGQDFTQRPSTRRAASKTTKLPAELLTLARLGRERFDSRYRRLGARTFGAV